MSLSDSMRSLKEFDFQNIDFNNAGSWPGAIKALACLIVIVAIAAGGYFALIKDSIEQLERLERKERDLKDEFRVKSGKVANLQAYRDQMKEMEERFGAMLDQLPSDTEVPGLLEDITFTGIGSGLIFEEIKLKPENKKEFYIELPINITVQGSYHGFGGFVSGVAGLPRIVTLHDYRIERDAKLKSLKMTIEARTYRYNDSQ